MRITVDLDPERVARAKQLSGIADVTELIHAALALLVSREAGRRLVALGGTEPTLRGPRPRRRRPADDVREP
jgi:hypothetical protein